MKKLSYLFPAHKITLFNTRSFFSNASKSPVDAFVMKMWVLDLSLCRDTLESEV